MPSVKKVTVDTKPKRKISKRFSFHMGDEQRAMVNAIAVGRSPAVSEAQIVREFIQMGLRDYAKRGGK